VRAIIPTKTMLARFIAEICEKLVTIHGLSIHWTIDTSFALINYFPVTT